MDVLESINMEDPDVGQCATYNFATKTLTYSFCGRPQINDNVEIMCISKSLLYLLIITCGLVMNKF